MTNLPASALVHFDAIRNDARALYALGVHHEQDRTAEGADRARYFIGYAALVHAHAPAFRKMGDWAQQAHDSVEATAHYTIAGRLGCLTSASTADRLTKTLSPTQGLNLAHRITCLMGQKGNAVYDAAQRTAAQTITVTETPNHTQRPAVFRM